MTSIFKGAATDVLKLKSKGGYKIRKSVCPSEEF